MAATKKATKAAATLTYMAGLDNQSRMLVIFTSNAARVSVKYQVPRKVKGKTKLKLVSRTLKVRRGSAQVLLPAGYTSPRAQAKGTRRLRASQWLPLAVTPTASPPSEPSSGETTAASPAPRPETVGGGGSEPSSGDTPQSSPPVTTPPNPLVGDINVDGMVDCADLAILKSEWGTASSRSDLDHNGIVGISDVSVMLSRWTGPTTNCDPEPSGELLLRVESTASGLQIMVTPTLSGSQSWTVTVEESTPSGPAGSFQRKINV